MKPLSFALILAWVVGFVQASATPNVLLICIDDLRPELKSFGVDYIHSPNIDQLAMNGRAFHRHYVQAPTCGASRYAMLTGCYGPNGNMALFERADGLQQETKVRDIPPSMPEWFRTHGYTTVSVGKVSHHPGGWGGEDWGDNTILEMPGAWDRSILPVGPWKTPRALMHGLANGVPRQKGVTPAIESKAGPDTIYPDGLISNEGIVQLQTLAKDQKPFFLAIGLMKPHLPFASPNKYLKLYDGVDLPAIPHPNKPDHQSTWHRSGEFFGQYNHNGQDPREDAEYAEKVRRHYAACVSFADQKVGEILSALEKTGDAENTIVVLWGDHGWNLGEHAIWGKHNLFEEALRSPLIVSVPGMKQRGEKTEAVVETVDIFPTLCQLAGLPDPDFVNGVSLVDQIKHPRAPGHQAFSYSGAATTLRTDSHRMILHRDGFVELYDHHTVEKETNNIADRESDLIVELKDLIHNKMASQRTRF